MDAIKKTHSPQAVEVLNKLPAADKIKEDLNRIEWQILPTPTKKLILNLVPWIKRDRNLADQYEYYTPLEKNQICAEIRRIKNAARTLEGFKI